MKGLLLGILALAAAGAIYEARRGVNIPLVSGLLNGGQPASAGTPAASGNVSLSQITPAVLTCTGYGPGYEVIVKKAQAATGNPLDSNFINGDLATKIVNCIQFGHP